MLTELNGKGGCVCEPARKGELRCPLIVRPTSEDVVTGELFGVLSSLQRSLVAAGPLNHALGTERFPSPGFPGSSNRTVAKTANLSTTTSDMD